MQKTLRQILLISLLIIFSISDVLGEDQGFNSIMKFDIKGIAVNGTFACDLNGFTHGSIDYGIYNNRGYYFAIINDNAIFGSNITIFESVSHGSFTAEAGWTGRQYDLVEMEGSKDIVKAKFWVGDKFVYFVFTKHYKGQDLEMLYILRPQ